MKNWEYQNDGEGLEYIKITPLSGIRQVLHSIPIREGLIIDVNSEDEIIGVEII